MKPSKEEIEQINSQLINKGNENTVIKNRKSIHGYKNN